MSIETDRRDRAYSAKFSEKAGSRFWGAEWVFSRTLSLGRYNTQRTEERQGTTAFDNETVCFTSCLTSLLFADWWKSPDGRQRFFLAMGAMCLALLVGAWLLRKFERWRKQDCSNDGHANQQLTSFRDLYEAGELSEEEYNQIRSVLSGKLRRELGPTPPPPRDNPDETPPSPPDHTPETPKTDNPPDPPGR